MKRGDNLTKYRRVASFSLQGGKGGGNYSKKCQKCQKNFVYVFEDNVSNLYIGELRVRVKNCTKILIWFLKYIRSFIYSYRYAESIHLSSYLFWKDFFETIILGVVNLVI